MNNTLIRIAMLGAIATLPLTATAAMQIDEAEAAVKAMLGEGSSAASVIEALVEDGRSLREATKTAVTASAGDNRIDLAKAGICAAADTAQAEKVGLAAIGVVGEGALADDIKGAISGYATDMCQPYAEKEKVAPSGYDTTANSAAGGGTVSPVSPAS